MMQKLITIFLLTLLFSAQFTEKAYARTSLLRAIVNFFKGGADDAIRNSGKSIENILNRAGKSPEGILSKSKVNKITEMETLARDESLILENVGQETHTNYYLSLNSSRAKPIKNRKWLRDLIEEGAEQGIEEIGEEGFQEAAEKGLNKMSAENDFYNYVNINWIGRVYIKSDYYSRPKVEKKMLLVCRTKYEIFYFSILMEEKIKTASLVDHKSLFSTSYPTLSEQELFVLKDEDEFKVMATQPEAGRYPKHYFTIFGNQSFNYDKRLNGTESPGIIIQKAFRGPDQSNNCYKATKKGLYRINE